MSRVCITALAFLASLGPIGGAQEKRVDEYLRAARNLLDKEKYLEAIEPLKHATAIDPALVGAYYQLGFCYWKLKRYEEAQRAFNRELDFQPPDPYSLYYLGRIAVARGNLGAAIDHFQKVVSIHPILDVHERLAAAYLETGNITAAIEHLEAAVRLHPERGDAHYRLGRAYLRAGRTTDAQQQFAVTQHLKREDQEAIRQLLECENHLKRNETEEAERIARDLAASHDPELLLALGKLLAQHDLHREAVPILNQAARLRPAFFEAEVNLGLSCRALKDYGCAIEAIQRCLRTNPESYEAQLLLGATLIEAKRDEEAIRPLRKAAQMRGDNSRLLTLLGLKYMEARYYKEAIATLNRAAAIDQGNPEIRFLLLQAHDRNQDFEQALKLAKQTLDAFPNLPRSVFEVGLRLHTLGRFSEARPYLEKAVAMDAEFAEARAMLGDVLLRDGKTEESLVHFRAALERKPDLIEASSGLGRALLQLKRYDEVVGEMQKAIRVSPESAQPYLYLSQAHRALGKLDQARKESEIFTRLNRERAERRDCEVEREYVE